jgi:hypothetical protein
MEMNCFSAGRFLRLLQDEGCHRVALRFSEHGGWLGLFILFRKGSAIDRLAV